jgi:hypothetical protein
MPKTTTWRNRIVGYADVAPDQLLANPLNYRVHPRNQQDALKGVISDIGFIDPVIVQQGTDTVIDGHLRVTLALRDNIPTIPVQYVDLTDAEAAEALATIDPLSAMAHHDADKLRDLLDQVSTGDAAVMQMLSELAEDAGVVPPSEFDPNAEWIGMPEFEQPDATGEYRVVVHLANDIDLAAFEELIGGRVPRDRWSVWYPYREPANNRDIAYIGDDSDAA